ncbi:MAG TPA: glycosyltransferase family 2 protein, partial [Gammaproteobacteria bacterium]
MSPRVSVVVPLNNEQANVEPLLDELREALRGLDPYEIIVVDDGSTDGTAAEIRRIGHETCGIRLLRHDTQRGQSTAIYNGVYAARADVVVTLDGDLQNHPGDIPPLLDRFSADPTPDNLGLLIGHRTKRRDSLIRRVSSVIANTVRARVLHDDTPDTGCGLKVFRRSVFMRLPYFDHMHRFLPALMLRAGYRVKSVAV